MKEIESYQEWKEELERHGKTPEEMVEWARENISEEYAGKLAEVIREYERQEKKRFQKRMLLLECVIGFSLGLITRCLPVEEAVFFLAACILIIIFIKIYICYKLRNGR